MPGFLMNVATKVLCAHGGQAQPTMPAPRVTVMGQPVVTQPAPYMIAGCANPPPPANVGPCVSAQWVSGAMRVMVMGQPVLLVDSKAICTPTGTPVNVIPAQTRVRGT